MKLEKYVHLIRGYDDDEGSFTGEIFNIKWFLIKNKDGSKFNIL